MEKYPLYINGACCGSLCVYNDGLMTCFEAECEDSNELIKLHIFGNGESAYLGTMQPRGNRLHLLKKFSRNEVSKLANPIEYAANAAIITDEKQIEEADESEDDGLLWFSTVSGYLTCFDGRQSLIAFPLDSVKMPYDNGIVRTISGKEYVVFPGKRNSSLSGNLP